MLHELKDYVKIYKNHVPVNLCDDSVEYLNQCDFVPHTFVNDQQIETTHTDGCSSYYDITPYNHMLMQLTHTAIGQYVQSLNFAWMSGWHGFTRPKYNRYVSGNSMKNHCDHIKDMFDGERRGIPILSIICVLNDSYSGGQLLMFEDQDYSLAKGDLIIFPSNFLYPHMITSITSGTRYSFASWVW